MNFKDRLSILLENRKVLIDFSGEKVILVPFVHDRDLEKYAASIHPDMLKAAKTIYNRDQIQNTNALQHILSLYRDCKIADEGRTGVVVGETQWDPWNEPEPKPQVRDPQYLDDQDVWEKGDSEIVYTTKYPTGVPIPIEMVGNAANIDVGPRGWRQVDTTHESIDKKKVFTEGNRRNSRLVLVNHSRHDYMVVTPFNNEDDLLNYLSSNFQAANAFKTYMADLKQIGTDPKALKKALIQALDNFSCQLTYEGTAGIQIQFIYSILSIECNPWDKPAGQEFHDQDEFSRDDFEIVPTVGQPSGVGIKVPYVNN
jgi:hypothetical protein